MRSRFSTIALVVLIGACGDSGEVPAVRAADGGALSSASVAHESGVALNARVAEVGPGFFVSPRGAWLGRLLVGPDFRAEATPMVVLTHSFWNDLGGEPTLVGSSLDVGGVPRVVVGVTPPGFAVPDDVDVWVQR